VEISLQGFSFLETVSGLIYIKMAKYLWFIGRCKIVTILIFSVKWSGGVCKISNDVSFRK